MASKSAINDKCASSVPISRVKITRVATQELCREFVTANKVPSQAKNVVGVSAVVTCRTRQRLRELGADKHAEQGFHYVISVVNCWQLRSTITIYFAFDCSDPVPPVRWMRPTPVMTPSASTSAIFRLSAAWCCTFLTNSSLMAFARAIYIQPITQGKMSTKSVSNIPP